MEVRHRLLTLVVWSVVCVPADAAIDRFVATNGSDSNPGTSALPWRTLQHAADVITAGTKVTVRAGNYAGFELETDGSPTAPIEFFAEPNVHITSAVPVRGDGINLEGASNIIIDGFNVADMPHAGVRSVGFEDDFATNVIIRNVNADHNGVWGIFTGHVNNVLIEQNVTTRSQAEHGIYVSNSGDNPIIRNNTIWGNAGSGIHMNGDESQGGDGIISGALVSGNIIYDNGTNGSGINMDCVQDSRIENNLIFNNHSSGISLYMIDGAEGSTGNVVINNTIHQASNGKWALNIQDGSTDNTVLNNIFLSNHSFRGSLDISPDSRSGFFSDYNVVMDRFTLDGGDSVLTLNQWRNLAGNANLDDHSFVATTAQLFQNVAGADYHLLPNAPAVNAGTTLLAPIPTIDLDGKHRPIGATIDIGAYEFGTALVGDYNSDGKVDALDYTVWRNTFGASGPNLPADGDPNGHIDNADFNVWKMHFGEHSGPGAGGVAVPEPTCLPAILLAAFLAQAAFCARSSR